MTERTARGSELLRARWSERDLLELASLEHEGVELVEFFPKGTPAPDGAWGSWRVTSDALAGLIARLLQQPVVPGIRIFPKGIPRPDVFDVVFEAGSARVR